MISKLSGKLTARGEGHIVIDVGGLGYEVLVPVVVEKALDALPLGEVISLETIRQKMRGDTMPQSVIGKRPAVASRARARR